MNRCFHGYDSKNCMACGLNNMDFANVFTKPIENTDKLPKEKKPSTKLSRDEQIRIAALNAAVPAWVHHHNMTCHADFKSKGLFDIVKDIENYIRTGDMDE